ncbi:hypothetical protein HII28_19410 [Planctomonas sp. JC2975]|uniref:GH116 family glycosyl-hydrolase n=1 Tax=Planctomonas sp. JC2975 TaxID=2729626 RepID=UPI0014754B8C|nr:GH116 family glycosyl-hydrolase [Planctomonas sp. JC2975]NNC14032.1 hypothetical protein [Planctomonas sp. JC2975]
MFATQTETGPARVGASALPWPVLRSYDMGNLDRISLPIGGVGTGTIGLGGRGDLRDFEIGNRPAKGFRPGTAFFALRVARPGVPAVSRVLEGPLGMTDFEGAAGSPAPNHGLPRFAEACFDAAYPFGQVRLNDPAMPEVRLQGFNPLIPGDLESSSWPLAAFRVEIANSFDSAIDVSVAAVVENFIGSNGTESAVGGNVNHVRRTTNLVGVAMSAPELDPKSEAAGTFVLAMMVDETTTATTRSGWADATWGNSLLDFWDDFTDDGRLDERRSSSARPIGSLAGSVSIPAGETRSLTFLMTWAFPNRYAWRSEDHHLDQAEYTSEIVGNRYCHAYPDPWQTALKAAAALPRLEELTVAAVTAIVDSAVPVEIREAALFNISTLRSPTVFRVADGRLYGWEGVMDRTGSCFGTCTHVWGYEFATSFWFAEFAWSLRETQYELATNDDGLMSFRVGLPTSQSQNWALAAADGQMASLIHLFHDWRLSGDDARLRRLWPAARKTLEFAWIAGGWDADRDGVMEGCQHNTMDVEYYGPNPQMGLWYLAALRAAAEMAHAVGDTQFAEDCRGLFASGSAWIDRELFTGEYYRHDVRPVGREGYIAPGLRHPSMGSVSLDDPDLQVADGVLVDQLVGQYAARLTRLGDVVDAEHVRTTLKTIFQRNFRPSLAGHFNHMRSFALADEAGLLMCTYDEGKRPARPFPYFNEVMTGFEYTAAVGMIQDGDRDQAMTVIRAIRARYDGARRNPFDEAECGHHYARAMASWSAFVAWNSFDFDGRTNTFTIEMADGDGTTFWSTGSAWGTWSQSDLRGELRIGGGIIRIDTVVVSGRPHALGEGATGRAGERYVIDLTELSADH